MKRVWMVLGLAGVASLAACQLERELNPTLDPADLYGSVEQPADLPVPRALELRVGANQSRYFAEGSFRSAFLIYEGRIGIEELRAFLRERLPDHAWELRNEDVPGRERAIQHWMRSEDGGVRYILQAEIETRGGVSRLSYDLRSSRSSVEAKAASAERRDAR